MRRLIPLSLILLVFAGVPALADEVDDARRALERAERELQQTQRALDEAERAARRIDTDLIKAANELSVVIAQLEAMPPVQTPANLDAAEQQAVELEQEVATRRARAGAARQAANDAGRRVERMERQMLDEARQDPEVNAAVLAAETQAKLLDELYQIRLAAVRQTLAYREALANVESAEQELAMARSPVEAQAARVNVATSTLRLREVEREGLEQDEALQTARARLSAAEARVEELTQTAFLRLRERPEYQAAVDEADIAAGEAKRAAQALAQANADLAGVRQQISELRRAFEAELGPRHRLSQEIDTLRGRMSDLRNRRIYVDRTLQETREDARKAREAYERAKSRHERLAGNGDEDNRQRDRGKGNRD